MDAPIGKGSAAVYGKRHLLQVLVIKAFQSRYLPIKRIREILWGKSNKELESILRDYVRDQPIRQRGLPHRDYPSEQLPMFEPDTPEEASWRRLALDDGVELHIRDDRMKELSRSEVKRIVDRLLTLLKVKYGR
jgi:DNA-binding transcriptional MerR regulator